MLSISIVKIQTSSVKENIIFSFIHNFLLNLAAPFLRTGHEEMKLQRRHQVIEEVMCYGESTTTLGEGSGCMKSNVEPKIHPQPHKVFRVHPLSHLETDILHLLSKSVL